MTTHDNGMNDGGVQKIRRPLDSILEMGARMTLPPSLEKLVVDASNDMFTLLKNNDLYWSPKCYALEELIQSQPRTPTAKGHGIVYFCTTEPEDPNSSEGTMGSTSNFKVRKQYRRGQIQEVIGKRHEMEEGPNQEPQEEPQHETEEEPQEVPHEEPQHEMEEDSREGPREGPREEPHEPQEEPHEPQEELHDPQEESREQETEDEPLDEPLEEPQDETLEEPQEETNGLYFLTLLSVEMIPYDLDGDIRKRYYLLLESVIAHPATPVPLKNFLAIVLREYGGSLGIDKNLIRQLQEAGGQVEFGFSRALEAFTFSSQIWNARVAATNVAVLAILHQLNRIMLQCLDPFSIASWMTGFFPWFPSTKICCTEAIVGTGMAGPYIHGSGQGKTWADPLNFPAKREIDPNTPTPKGLAGFSTDYHPMLIWSVGIPRFFHFVRMGRNNGRLLIVDRNKVIFETQLHLEGILVNHFGYKIVLRVFCDEEGRRNRRDDEMVVFLHFQYNSALILHGPLGICGDSRDYISVKCSILRGMTLETLIQVAASVRSESAPRMDRANGSGLQSGYNFEMAYNACHQSKKSASAIQKQSITPQGFNAILCSNLKRANPSQDYPTSIANRRIFNGTGHNNPITSRTMDTSIISRGMCKLSYADTPSCLPTIISAIDTLFRKEEDQAKERWSYFFGKFRDSPFKQTLRNVYKNVVLGDRRGNEKPKLGHNKDDLEAIQDEFLPILERFADSKKAFWIRKFHASTQEERDTVPNASDLPIPYTGEYVVRSIAHRGVATKLNKKIQVRGQETKFNIQFTGQNQQYMGFVRCRIVSVQEPRKSNAHPESVNKCKAAEFQAALAMPRGTPFWIRKKGTPDSGDMAKNLPQPSDLPEKCQNENVYGHLVFSNVRKMVKKVNKNVARGPKPNQCPMFGFQRVILKDA